MKYAMNTHVGQRSDTMFRESTETVKSHLDQICSTVRDQMRQQTKFVLDSIKRDYQTLFGGQHFQAVRPPHVLVEDRALKTEVSAQIKETHEVFRKVVGAPSPSPEPEVAQQEPDAGADASTDERAQGFEESLQADNAEQQIKLELEAALEARTGVDAGLPELKTEILKKEETTDG